MKSNDEWEEQRERLAWRVSIRDGVPFLEARDRVHERAIRLGKSPANMKFLRMIRKAMRRKGLTFREAVVQVWDRIALSWMKKFVRGIRVP
jgi:hypothetical protein